MTMSQLLTDPKTETMSVCEFRKLTGSATSHLSDEQVKKAVQELALMAELYFKGASVGSSEKTE